MAQLDKPTFLTCGKLSVLECIRDCMKHDSANSSIKKNGKCPYMDNYKQENDEKAEKTSNNAKNPHKKPKKGKKKNKNNEKQTALLN